MDDIQYWLARVFSRTVGRKEAEPTLPDPFVLADAIEAGQDQLSRLQTRVDELEDELGKARHGRMQVAE
jgi:hypothetical protein